MGILMLQLLVGNSIYFQYLCYYNFLRSIFVICDSNMQHSNFDVLVENIFTFFNNILF